MSTYHVAFHTTAFTMVTVEADSPEEARDLADQQFVAPRVCAQCSGWGRGEGELPLEIGDDWEQDESEMGVWRS